MKRITFLLLPVLLAALPLVDLGCELNELGTEVVTETDGGDSAVADDVVTTADVITMTDSAPPPLLTNWCSTTGAGHDFCADFDSSLKGNEPGAWCNGMPAAADCGITQNGGALTLDTAQSTSPPNSASAQEMLGGGSSQAFLFHNFSGALHPVNLAFDVRVDTIGAGTTTIANLTLENDGTNSHRIELHASPAPSDAGSDAGAGMSLSLVEFPVAGAPRTTPLTASLVVGKFARVAINVGVAPNIVTVTVDGASPGTAIIDGSSSATGRAVQLGVDSAAADTWQLHVDDVTFDFTK